jgi:hypothetical protein
MRVNERYGELSTADENLPAQPITAHEDVSQFTDFASS